MVGGVGRFVETCFIVVVIFVVIRRYFCRLFLSFRAVIFVVCFCRFRSLFLSAFSVGRCCRTVCRDVKLVCLPRSTKSHIWGLWNFTVSIAKPVGPNISAMARNLINKQDYHQRLSSPRSLAYLCSHWQCEFSDRFLKNCFYFCRTNWALTTGAAKITSDIWLRPLVSWLRLTLWDR